MFPFALILWIIGTLKYISFCYGGHSFPLSLWQQSSHVRLNFSMLPVFQVNTAALGVTLLLQTMNRSVKNIACPDCKGKWLSKTTDDTMLSCRNQKQTATLPCNHIKAIIAIARMMMVCIYHIVPKKKLFTPDDYEELMGLGTIWSVLSWIKTRWLWILI